MNTGSTIVIKLPEVVSGKVVRGFMRKLKSALRLDEPCVIVDLGQVKHIDTAGLDMLLQCLVQVANRDGSLKLAGISPQAATVLELTRMDQVFNMFPTVSEAIATCEEIPQFESIPGEAVQET